MRQEVKYPIIYFFLFLNFFFSSTVSLSYIYICLHKYLKHISWYKQISLQIYFEIFVISGAVYLVQAGVFLIAIFGFLIIFLTFRSNGNLEWAVMVPDEEEECVALVGFIPESRNSLGVPDDARHRKMSRKVSHASLMFNL